MQTDQPTTGVRGTGYDPSISTCIGGQSHAVSVSSNTQLEMKLLSKLCRIQDRLLIRCTNSCDNKTFLFFSFLRNGFLIADIPVSICFASAV